MPAYSATDGQRLAEALSIDLMARVLTRGYRQAPIMNLRLRRFDLTGGAKLEISVIEGVVSIEHDRHDRVYLAREWGGLVLTFRPGAWVRELQAIYEAERPEEEEGPGDRFEPLGDW